MAFSTYGPAEEIPKSAPLSSSGSAINPDKFEGGPRVKVIHAGAEKMLPVRAPGAKLRLSPKRVGRK